ncbi:Protein FAM161A [Pseudolycoriella hygida]|uniref:Protein FAM161A n=1 Tax=Pseudolycoriella hygida TaxID=35572 RepID=A0A9Q0MYI5_9DIPT|nr:Protein FAM161A [Pseudolycoriella hygida]
MPICENNAFKSKKYSMLECTNSKYSSRANAMKKTNKTLNKECRNKDNDFYSLITFYDSIPDYRDIHHLSEYEFQNQLLMLKQRQCEIFPHKSDRQVLKQDIPEIQCESVPASSCKNTDFDIDFAGLLTKNDEINNSLNNCLGNKPVIRINSAKSSSGSGGKCYRSKSVSPSRLTVPQPFKMTLREEKEQKLNELLTDHQQLLDNDKDLTDEIKISTTHDIPLSSRIPLYDRIVAEKAHKSELAKLNSAIELQSQMKPFHFSERSPCRLKRCHTSPQLTTPNSKTECFRAKPCPKNLFSNYFYHKLWEDEYFRALNRKLRAEELLKISSLPPSMKKRNKDSPKSEKSSTSSGKRGKRRKKITKKLSNDLKDDEFITTCPNPFKFETEKRSTTRSSKSPTYCFSNNTSGKSSYQTSPIPIYPSARPNLAANLRVEWARKKLSELSMKSEKNLPKEKVRRTSWGIRKSPGWKSLYYDHTNEEDISLRLATRRAEQKLRHDEHQLKMEIMRQRVRAAPLLLEGPSHWGPRTVAHDCRFGKSNSHDKTDERPCSSNATFSTYFDKKFEPKRKTTQISH